MIDILIADDDRTIASLWQITSRTKGSDAQLFQTDWKRRTLREQTHLI
jgi:hypothetical protein